MCIKIHIICCYCTQTYPKYDSILPCRLPNQAGQASDSPLTRPSIGVDTPPAYSPSINDPRALAPNFSLPSSPAPLRSNPTFIPRSDSVAVGPPTPADRVRHQSGTPLPDSPTLGVLAVPRIATPIPIRTSALNSIPRCRSSLQSSSTDSLVVSPLSAEETGNVTALRPAPQMPRRADTPRTYQAFAAPLPQHRVRTPRPSSQGFAATRPNVTTQEHRVSGPPVLSVKPRYAPNVPELARQCKAYKRRWVYVTCSRCGEALSRKIAAQEEYQLARMMRRVEIERGMAPINLNGVIRPRPLGEGEEPWNLAAEGGKRKKKGACVMM